MDAKECVTPKCSFCMQELYTGGKDCNILAWVPVLRSPEVEEESQCVNQVGNKMRIFRDTLESQVAVLFIYLLLSVLNDYCLMSDMRS